MSTHGEAVLVFAIVAACTYTLIVCLMHWPVATIAVALGLLVAVAFWFDN
jgi:hypothetical protein